MEQNLPSQQKTSLLRRFLPYLLRYKGILVFDLVCAGLTTLCELVLPLMLRAITNRAAEDLASLTLGFILQVGAVYLVLRVLDAAANYFMQSTGHVMGAHIETDMRRDAFAHLQRLSDAYFASTKVGQIMGRLTNDLFDVTEFAHHCPEEFFIAILKGTAAFIILLRTNVPLTLLIFACLPVMLVCCTRFNHMVRVTFRRQRRQIGELNARIEDSLLGERVVKAFSGEEAEKEKFERDNASFLSIKKDMYHWMAAFNTTTRLFDGLMYLVVIVAGYTDLMDRFIHSNPGLESRFNRFLLFEDYTSDEMLDIFKMQCKKGCYQLSDGVEELVRDYITEENGDPETFGNARGVRNIFEHILVAQNNRLAAMETVTKEDLMTLTQDDVLHARGKLD